MAYFEWNSQVELGNPILDAHHKRLFALSEAVARSLTETTELRHLAGALQELIEFTREHFTAEERIMRQANYPNTEVHSEFHTLLLAELEQYWLKIQQEGNANLTVTGLVAFLWHWLILHIDSADREVVKWLATH